MYLATLLTLEEDYSKHGKDLEKGKFHKIGIQETVSGENESKLQYAFSSFMLRKLSLLTGQEQRDRVYLMECFMYLSLLLSEQSAIYNLL